MPISSWLTETEEVNTSMSRLSFSSPNPLIKEFVPNIKAILSSDRADIILPGAMVLLAVMDRLKAKSLELSVNGLREGVFFELFWSHIDLPIIPNVKHFSVLNLARNCYFEKEHANHVSFLAGRLFEQLAPLHGYGAKERDLLYAAALLHDLDRIIGYTSHHKHSQTLIEYNGCPGTHHEKQPYLPCSADIIAKANLIFQITNLY